MKKLRFWLVDYWYMVKNWLADLFFTEPPKDYLEKRGENKSDIIILPGLLGKWSFMKCVADMLSEEGHAVHVILDLKNNLFDIPHSAEIVQEYLEKKNITGAIFVAHSKGGLIGKYFLHYLNKDKRVLGMISLATPFAGTAMAKMIPHKAVKELSPESPIIEELGKNKEVNKQIISIMASFDNHVWPKEGVILEDALENITVEAFGHHKIVFDKETHKIIKKSIRKFSE